MKPVIQTERLILREWSDDDLEPFARMNADPDVMKHFPAPLTREESDALAARVRHGMKERGFGWWVLDIRGGPSFAGVLGLTVPAFDPPFRCTSPCVEIGWRLARSAWGHGYATEAARAALAHGFDVLGLEEIVSFTVPANVRSWSVMERLGMSRRPEDDFDHPRLPEGHALRRHILYRVRRPSAK
jgi:ribosomal-protein-alanine N-acetyltransferase